jgi:tetratricopeptide (TPR) repeat protein
VTGGYYGVIINHIAKGSADHRVDLLGEHSAVFWHYQYHKEYNAPTLLKAKDALERSLESNPKYALGWAILGEILLDSYLLEINPETIITKSEEFARKAIRLDPYCLHGYQTLAWTYLLQNNREASIQTINECLSDHDHNTDNMGWLALSLVFLGEYERGKQLLDKAMLLNPFYPWCYSFTMSAYYYFNKEYEQAYFWAERINMPSLKFDVTMRAVILGRLNNSNKTKKILKELLELWPDVATEARSFFKKFILHEPATEHMIEGLTIAGVKVV